MQRGQVGQVILCCALGLVGLPLRVERVEVNTVVGAEGEPKLTQVILWDRYAGSCLHVRDWRMAEHVHVIPRGHDAVLYWRHDSGRVDRIVADNLLRTFTTDDPEEADRPVLPVEQRESIFIEDKLIEDQEKRDAR